MPLSRDRPRSVAWPAHDRRGAPVPTARLALWIPVAGLALLEKRVLPGCCVAVPSFTDVGGSARSLLVVPLLLIARPVLAAAWRLAGARFRERGIIGREDSFTPQLVLEFE